MTVVGAVATVWALFRRLNSEPTKSSASGQNARSTQVVNSPKSTIVTDSPSAIVVGRDLNLTSGYAVDEHERIVNQRIAESRADLERAYQAEIDALRTQIAALTEPEWDRHTVEAVQAALTAKRFDLQQGIEFVKRFAPPDAQLTCRPILINGQCFRRWTAQVRAHYYGEACG